jgi:hypothetical protein
VVALTLVRALVLSQPSHPSALSHLSAASGLVRSGDRLFVVADDELHLGVFPAAGDAPGHLVRLFEGDLPAAKPARKQRKPDLEALTLLPPMPSYPHGALVALGSGSTPQRCRGIVLGLDAGGDLSGQRRIFDLEPLYRKLGSHFAELNIEGATIASGELNLFQRGNIGQPLNGVARFPLTALIDAMEHRLTEAIEPIDVHAIDLGRLGNVPYSITDATALPDGRTLVTAVAEETEDSYADGACLGAMIAVLSTDWLVERRFVLDGARKIEGVWANVAGHRADLMLVTDADDPSIAASLFSATIRL